MATKKMTINELRKLVRQIIKESSRSRTYKHTFYLINPKTQNEEEFIMWIKTYYDPGVHTFRNGDPGYPEESGEDLESWERTSDSSQPEWVTDEMIDNEFLSAIDNPPEQFDDSF